VSTSLLDPSSPDPNISVEELGVPLKIAMIETFPETVTAHNIDRLRDMVFNGPNNSWARNVAEWNFHRSAPRGEGVSSHGDQADVVDRHLRTETSFSSTVSPVFTE
jgi:DNA-directed RNA polymerase beta' subunit